MLVELNLLCKVILAVLFGIVEGWPLTLAAASLGTPENRLLILFASWLPAAMGRTTPSALRLKRVKVGACEAISQFASALGTPEEELGTSEAVRRCA